MDNFSETLLHVILQLKRNVSHDTTEDLLAGGQIDSFDIVNIVAAIEAKFCVEIDPEDILPTNFNSIDNMARLLIEKYDIDTRG